MPGMILTGPAALKYGYKAPGTIFPSSNSSSNVNSTYNNSVASDNSNYNSLMDNYRNLLGNVQGTGVQLYTPDLPQFNKATYTPTADYTNSIGQLQNWTKTGGYSDADIQNLRARAVNPITAAYAGANRDIDRSRTIQGGFSPAYGALKAKMARESSAEMANSLVNANAGIAENVNKNKAAALDKISSLAASDQESRNQFAKDEQDRENEFNAKIADIQNLAKQFNIQQAEEKNKNILDVLNSIKSLYGTTPARSELFGSQALNTAGLQNNINQGNRNNGLDAILKLIQAGGA